MPAAGQQALFSSPAGDPRVIPFDSLTSPAEREFIRARAAELARPAPLKTAKVEVRHARPRQTRSTDQRQLDFLNQQEIAAHHHSHIICDAPVAPPGLRIEAAVIDGLLMLMGCAAGFAMFRYAGGHVALTKQVLPFALIALATVPFFYKLLFTFTGQETIGMRRMGLCLVDFDGNPPSQSRRYHRFLGSILSLLAAGIGLVWSLVDEDKLTWHDHISGTFATIAGDD